ncbi:MULTISPECIES: FHA domain-containing protein [Pseudomonas]|uniref:FHA domain-containing protein n=1 Tax=Pseudomonas TaxID=286 RepID=UPI001BEC27A1|nr:MULTISPECIES: FHA domain-containing protein [Pseudomonas]MBT2340254.1 type III secretion protein [Pseudomonas fluorescens]MCD4530262.1 type III secretion protein [Pseudomonas sp. C3-2018]
MFELRVLSGLHRGAALPLVGDEWVVGAAEDADLALYDPGICAHHARLSQVQGQWLLDPVEGAVCDAQGQPWAPVASLAVGVPFAAAGIWLCLAPADQPWPQEGALDETAAVGGNRENPKAATRPSWPRRLAIAAAVITVASSAWAFTSQPAQTVAPTPAQQLKRSKVTLDTVAAVRLELDRMLQERDLAAHVQIVSQDDRLVLEGELPRQRMAVVERLMERFAERYETPVQITANVREHLAKLPFQIAQIVGGKRGHVVTSDGRRLFLGDQIDGLRLTAIGSDKVTFEGDQRYEVTW